MSMFSVGSVQFSVQFSINKFSLFMQPGPIRPYMRALISLSFTLVCIRRCTCDARSIYAKVVSSPSFAVLARRY